MNFRTAMADEGFETFPTLALCLCCLILYALLDTTVSWCAGLRVGCVGAAGTQGAGSTDCLGVARAPVKLPMAGSFHDGPLTHTSSVVLSVPDQGWPHVTNRMR